MSGVKAIWRLRRSQTDRDSVLGKKNFKHLLMNNRFEGEPEAGSGANIISDVTWEKKDENEEKKMNELLGQKWSKRKHTKNSKTVKGTNIVLCWKHFF